jgi:hypothetical protein
MSSSRRIRIALRASEVNLPAPSLLKPIKVEPSIKLVDHATYRSQTMHRKRTAPEGASSATNVSQRVEFLVDRANRIDKCRDDLAMLLKLPPYRLVARLKHCIRIVESLLELVADMAHELASSSRGSVKDIVDSRAAEEAQARR